MHITKVFLGIIALTTHLISATLAAPPLDTRLASRSTSCYYLPKLILNKWTLTIEPQSGQGANDCGKAYLEGLANEGCVVTTWKCLFVEGEGLSITFNARKVCGADKVERVMRKGSMPPLEGVNCYQRE